jgi:hypothetical protein
MTTSTPFSRRRLLTSTLFGAGGVGLRALATGLPLSFLLDPRRALADGLPACGDPARAQYFILSTSGNGDPLNANVPGCYLDPGITHSPTLGTGTVSLGGTSWTAGAPWADPTVLDQAVLDRTTFWHLMTNTPIHPEEPDVLRLKGAISGAEMLPSLLAKHQAACLGTVQAQPITIGASGPSEGLSFGGQALPIIPPVAIAETLLAPPGPLGTLQQLRNQTLIQLSDVLRTSATSAQKRSLDAMLLSQNQIKDIDQALLHTLSTIKNNSVDSQIAVALALIQMKVTPVVAIHIPFGGDNHFDAALATETAQTQTGVQSIGKILQALRAAQLQDQVTFLSLNVFGRTLKNADNGRQHNSRHQVSIAIGKPFRGGVIGSVASVGTDYGAQPFSSTGGGSADIQPLDTLAAFGRTLLSAVGVPDAVASTAIPTGKVVTTALS